MDAMSVLMPILIVALIAFVVALVFMVLRLMKTLQAANDTIAKLEPTLSNVETLTKDFQPTVKKIEPIVDRVQLTLDSVNLEMMRVDKILEDVSQITDSAASATSAVDNITSAPAKAVSGMATRVRERFGSKSASDESTSLGEQRAAVAQALEDYKAAEALEEEQETVNPGYTEVEEVAAADAAAEPAPQDKPANDDKDKPYMVIDPDVLETSPFFEGASDGE